MFVALDLETTGLDLSNDEIIEIAIVKINSQNFEIEDKFTSLINPWIEIPKIITNITWIKTEDILLSPYIDEIKEKIIDFVWDLPILGHNIEFDINFLEKYSINFKNNILIDSFYLANFLDFDKKSLSLESLCIDYDIEFEWAHRALNDILVNVKLFEKQVLKINSLQDKQKEILKYIFSKTNYKWFAYIIDNFLDKKISLIDSSIFLKYIIKNFKKYNKKDEIIIDKNLNIDNSRQVLSKIKWLDIRENQEKMIDIVDNCLDNNLFKLVEAPTWVWKTFAYLLPSILYSIKTWEQVFISTTTKALQDQIFYKDLKFLQDNLECNFSYSKLKWKRNYFSLFSFIKFLGNIEYYSIKEASFVLKIVFWLWKTKSFELEELDYFGEEFSFKQDINADDSLVFSKKNIYEKIEPIFIARKKAKKSNIVVINNSILFQDIAWENNILWNIKNLVLDEAHNLEDVVTNSLKKSFSLKDLEKIFKNIELLSKKHKYEIKDFEKNKDDLIFNFWILFDLLEEYLNQKVKSEDYKNVLIEEDFYKNNVDNLDIEKLWKNIKSLFLSIIDSIRITPDDLYLELSKELAYIDNILDIVDKILDKSWDKQYIRTINFSNFKGLYIEYSMLNIWDFLEKNIYSKLDSCLLTSATLSINNDFSYIKNILSLEKFDFTRLDSDFDYKKQALVYIPNDLWNIKNNFDTISKFIKDFSLIVKGQTLVLFTALYIIKKVYENIAIDLKKQNINLYAQSIWWGKNKLLEFYKKNYKNSVLLWTDTFWEGIDLVWEELKYLVIHKIPFMVPSDPVFIARSKLFKDSFRDYSLSKAIIKLKQGFWRLIRTKKDSGIVIFLDDRIYNTSWWEFLYWAFPKDIKIKIWSSQNLLKVLKK